MVTDVNSENVELRSVFHPLTIDEIIERLTLKEKVSLLSATGEKHLVLSTPEKLA
jgi:hypothetical protein